MEWEQNRWTDEAGTFLSAVGFLQALETGLDGYLQQEERGKRYPLACRPFSITWFMLWRRLLLSGSSSDFYVVLRTYKTAEANPFLSVHTFSIGTFVSFSVRRRMEWTGSQKDWILTSALLCDDGQVP